MPRRSMLSAAERNSLLEIPTTQNDLIQRYAFNEWDLSIIRQHRGPENRLGFAVHLCYMRYPGVILGHPKKRHSLRCYRWWPIRSAFLWKSGLTIVSVGKRAENICLSYKLPSGLRRSPRRITTATPLRAWMIWPGRRTRVPGITCGGVAPSSSRANIGRCGRSQELNVL